MKKIGYHYFSGLYHALTYGIKHYAEDTPERTQIFADNENLVAGAMLVSLFSYMESTLGDKWISRLGGNQKRELECLKLVRDAFVHKNGHIMDLGVIKNDRSLVYKLRSFIDDLQSGKITDDKGNEYPPYMTIDDDGVVKMNSDALLIFANIGKVICH
ncbi:hypothetical protein [Marinicella meishanensis]|uniref:hypothetical protein n=1 Tax=Marinicella meishanensis TaxID=2873263 RepID=UPI001CBADD97|nr:hypothetical protein [Marinicella sp. NBU2979]